MFGWHIIQGRALRTELRTHKILYLLIVQKFSLEKIEEIEGKRTGAKKEKQEGEETRA